MRQRLLVTVIIGVLTLQVTVPLVQLLRGDLPARFGWQMYSASPEWPTIEVVDTDDNVTALDESDIRKNRGEMRADERLANALCRENPDVVQVRVHHGDTVQSFDCSAP
ncbi:hypothetical protein [Halostreptopolyspora alba]|uniref:Uncharacterized protein n=1 Tax=Halostreptopolyspora alba TaxID=2487137 RepID=A0A3N0E6N9_9ACTN|nr:hypothetical protein EFW17_15970 [Nocardiopsaceae bacterium YIM 96095]